MADILIIGETCKDIFVYGECDRLCPEAPAPVFNPIEVLENPGMAMNVQRNVVKLGQKCHIYTNPNWKHITKTRYVHKNTNQMFVRVDTNDDKIERCKVEKISFEKYKIIIISDYCKGFLTEEDIAYITHNHNCVFLDTKKRLGKWCEKASFIKINNYESAKTAHTIPDTVKDKMITTLGSRGCTFKNKIFSVEAVEIKDVSGAGDTFLAALAVKYVETENIIESINFANTCATQVVQKRGVSTV